MKANELMIGDWMMYNPNVFIEDEYEPIRECLPTKINNGEDINLAIEGCYTPIPLTPEILEKNGFRIIFEGDLHVSYFQDIESFHTEVKVDKIGIYQKLSMLDGLGNRVTIVECKYVHQLQHALRLCGIEKIIEL